MVGCEARRRKGGTDMGLYCMNMEWQFEQRQKRLMLVSQASQHTHK